jgi:hypothetical protein
MRTRRGEGESCGHTTLRESLHKDLCSQANSWNLSTSSAVKPMFLARTRLELRGHSASWSAKLEIVSLTVAMVNVKRESFFSRCAKSIKPLFRNGKSDITSAVKRLIQSGLFNPCRADMIISRNCSKVYAKKPVPDHPIRDFVRTHVPAATVFARKRSKKCSSGPVLMQHGALPGGSPGRREVDSWRAPAPSGLPIMTG